MSQGQIVLIQGDEPAARRRAEQLGADGWEVTLEAEDGGRASRLIHAARPAVVVVDLTRRPSRGREVGRSLRETRATRGLPLAFVDGDTAARERVAAQVPGAVFATWAELGAVLAQFSQPGDEETFT